MERLGNRVTADPHQEVIKRYCAEARQLLEQAVSEEEAIAIRGRLCSQLARECDSRLVLDATQSYVDHVIEGKWKTIRRNESQ